MTLGYPFYPCVYSQYIKLLRKYVARITGKHRNRSMNMTRLKISKTLLAVTLGSVLVSGSALAESSTMDKAQSTADTAGQKIDSSMIKSAISWTTAQSQQK